MNKKAFTLIELLAVVMVLGIIAVIAVPSISNVINTGKEKALFATANNLVDTAKQYYLNEVLVNDELASAITLSVTDSANMALLEYSGKLPSGGYIIVDTVGNIGLAVSQGDYCAKKELWDDEVVVSSAADCDISDLADLELINNSCFILNDNKDTIIDYKITDSNCSKDVIIPAEIGGRKIVAIGVGAFAGKGQLVSNFVNYGELYNDIIENISFYGMEPFETFLVDPTVIVNKQCYFNTYDSSNDLKPIDYILTSSSGYVGCRAGVDSSNQSASYGITSVNFNLAVNLKKIDYAAFLNNDITSLVFTNSNISIENIAANAFTSNMIDGSLDLSSLTNLKTIGSFAFDGNLITSVIFPEGLDSIGHNTFRDNNITSIVLSSTIKNIGIGAFLYNNIETLDLTSATKLTVIQDNAFEGNLLTSVSLPASILEIEDDTFIDNDSLLSISLNKEYGTVQNRPWGAINAQIIWAASDKYEISYSGSDFTLGDTCLSAGSYYENCNVILNATDISKSVISFKLNGITVIGNIFKMPSNDVSITDVVFAEHVILESSHPYYNGMDEIYTITVPDAVKIRVTFSSDTIVENGYDYIYLSDGLGTQVGALRYTSEQLADQMFTIDGNTLNVRLTSDGTGALYGFLAKVIIAE